MNVIAEDAGKVWKIEARPPVVTPAAGKLLELRVKEGDVVNEGDVLAVTV